MPVSARMAGWEHRVSQTPKAEPPSRLAQTPRPVGSPVTTGGKTPAGSTASESQYHTADEPDSDPASKSVSDRMAQWQEHDAKAAPSSEDESTAYSVTDRMSAWEVMSASNKVSYIKKVNPGSPKQSPVRPPTLKPTGTPKKPTPFKPPSVQTKILTPQKSFKECIEERATQMARRPVTPVTALPPKPPATQPKSPMKGNSPSRPGPRSPVKVGSATKSLQQKLIEKTQHSKTDQFAEKMRNERMAEVNALKNRFPNGVPKTDDELSDNEVKQMVNHVPVNHWAADDAQDDEMEICEATDRQVTGRDTAGAGASKDTDPAHMPVSARMAGWEHRVSQTPKAEPPSRLAQTPRPVGSPVTTGGKTPAGSTASESQYHTADEPDSDPASKSVSDRMAQWQEHDAKAAPSSEDEPTAYSVTDRMSAWEVMSASNKVSYIKKVNPGSPKQSPVRPPTLKPTGTPKKPTPFKPPSVQTKILTPQKSFKECIEERATQMARRPVTPVTALPPKPPATQPKSPMKGNSPSRPGPRSPVKVGSATKSLQQKLIEKTQHSKTDQFAEKMRNERMAEVNALKNRFPNGVPKTDDELSDNEAVQGVCTLPPPPPTGWHTETGDNPGPRQSRYIFAETRTKSEETPATVRYEQHSRVTVVSNLIRCLEQRTDKDCLALPSNTAHSLPIGDRDIEAKPLSVRDTVDHVQYKNELDSGGESEPDVDTLPDPRNDVASMAKKQIDDFQSSPGTGLKIFFTEEKTKTPLTTKQAFQALAVLSETPFRLCDQQLTVKSPDRAFERLQKNENVPRNTGLTSEQRVPHWRGDVLEYTGAPHFDISTSDHEAEVSQPMVSDIQHVPSKSGGVDAAMFNSDLQAQPASCDSGTSFVNKDEKSYRGEGNRRRNTSKQRYKKQRAQQPQGLDNKDQEKVSLNSKKIQLLKIGAFCKKLTECTSSLNEQESCVIFSGSHDEIISGKVKMYETLGKIEECFEDMPLQTIKLLSRPECKMHIKWHLIRNKVYAVVEADLNSSRLQSSAYYRDQALKALEHVNNEISDSFIKLREGQQRMVQEKEFNDLLDGLNTGLVCVYVENAESKIVIKGLTNMKVTKARQSLIDYLKSNTPRTQTKFSLNGAEARCFQVKIKTELQRKISQMKGTIQVTTTKLDPPIQVDIMVTGDTAAANATSECLKSIWHEKFDFSKISSVEKEIKLVMHGLAGSHGRTFVQVFERKMGCFIDLTQKGEYSVKPPSMETVKVSRLDSPILTDDKSGRSVMPSEKTEQFRGGIREDDTPVFNLEGEMPAPTPQIWDTDIYSSYQGGLSEKEALRQALLQSQSEGGTMATETDILDRRLHGLGTTDSTTEEPTVENPTK